METVSAEQVRKDAIAYWKKVQVGVAAQVAEFDRRQAEKAAAEEARIALTESEGGVITDWLSLDDDEAVEVVQVPALPERTRSAVNPATFDGTTVEVRLQGVTKRLPAELQNGGLYVTGMVGKYITGTRPWGASITHFLKDGKEVIEFGFDSKSGRHNKSCLFHK